MTNDETMKNVERSNQTGMNSQRPNLNVERQFGGLRSAGWCLRFFLRLRPHGTWEPSTLQPAFRRGAETNNAHPPAIYSLPPPVPPSKECGTTRMNFERPNLNVQRRSSEESEERRSKVRGECRRWRMFSRICWRAGRSALKSAATFECGSWNSGKQRLWRQDAARHVVGNGSDSRSQILGGKDVFLGLERHFGTAKIQPSGGNQSKSK